MSKSKDLEKKKSTAVALPEWMQQYEREGTDDLGQYVVPPRLKVVQPTSGEPFNMKFDQGDVVAVPQIIKIAGMEDKITGEPFYFTPLFFFAEWCLWNPIELKGTHSAVRERTFDAESEIAIRSRDPKLWSVKCPELPDKMMRYVEHLNFVVALKGDHELAGTPCILPFARAEHKAGSNLAALIKMRAAPLFGCNFEGRVGFRTNNHGQWYGIDVTNPAGDSGVTPFVEDEVQFNQYRQVHKGLKEAHDNRLIKVDYEEGESPQEPTDTPNEF
jgi:hypothetical protein